MKIPSLLLSLVFSLVVHGFAAAKPNIIVIYTDDHGWPDIGAAGIYDDLKTPHINALATSGVRATNGYSTAPQCVPSRAGLLIGKSQNRFGVESNGQTLDGFDAELTIAERLKKAGYATGQIGKWHLGQNNKITDHGFDDVYSKNANRSCFANYTLDGKTVEMQMVDDKTYHLDACSEAALAFIRRHEKKPFFLYLAYRAPHVPLDAPKKYLDRFPGKMPERRRQALAMLSSMDDGIGKIVAELKERKLTEKTLIFYIGDNGAPLKIHKLDAPGGGPGWDGSLNEPMNGEKGMLSEGGIRVPFLVSWPGKIPANQIYDHPVSALDVAATSVEIAGLEKDESLDGVNLIPFLSGEDKEAPHDALFFRWIAQAAVREGKWKLLVGGKRVYLYDLDADQGEKHNVLTSYPDVARRLRGKLESWASELQPPGLDTKGMSVVWEQYFDFYLDGKPAPPLRAKFDSKNTTESAGGWIVRNGKLSIKDDTLHVVSDKKGKKGPFIVTNELGVTGPATATIRLRSATGGKVGISWRKEGDEDFLPGQITQAELPASKEWRDVTLKLPVSIRIIHVRILLPPGDSEIKFIGMKGEKKNEAKTWTFIGS